MSDKYEIYECNGAFGFDRRVLKNGKAVNEFGLLKDIQKLQAENAELKKQIQWISVEDAVDCTDYLCTDGEIVKELHYSRGLFFAYDGNPEPISGITHVMPLPTPPEGE